MASGGENVTVSDVAVACVTLPVAGLAAPLNTTVFADGDEASKPVPAITSDVAPTATVAVDAVTTGAGGGGPGGVGGEGPGGLGGLLGTTTNPTEEVCGSPVVGSTGSAASGAAVTAKLLF